MPTGIDIVWFMANQNQGGELEDTCILSGECAYSFRVFVVNYGEDCGSALIPAPERWVNPGGFFYGNRPHNNDV